MGIISGFSAAFPFMVSTLMVASLLPGSANGEFSMPDRFFMGLKLMLMGFPTVARMCSCIGFLCTLVGHSIGVLDRARDVFMHRVFNPVGHSLHGVCIRGRMC